MTPSSSCSPRSPENCCTQSRLLLVSATRSDSTTPDLFSVDTVALLLARYWM